ncbi:hypothetical protein STEG23_034794, partial [Scotinomys teguina]
TVFASSCVKKRKFRNSANMDFTVLKNKPSLETRKIDVLNIEREDICYFENKERKIVITWTPVELDFKVNSMQCLNPYASIHGSRNTMKAAKGGGNTILPSCGTMRQDNYKDGKINVTRMPPQGFSFQQMKTIMEKHN